jgi:hypothetical protein
VKKPLAVTEKECSWTPEHLYNLVTRKDLCICWAARHSTDWTVNITEVHKIYYVYAQYSHRLNMSFHFFTDFLLCLTNFLGLFLPEALRKLFSGYNHQWDGLWYWQWEHNWKRVHIMGDWQLYTDSEACWVAVTLHFYKYVVNKMPSFTSMFNNSYRSGFYAGTVKSLVTTVSLIWLPTSATCDANAFVTTNVQEQTCCSSK